MAEEISQYYQVSRDFIYVVPNSVSFSCSADSPEKANSFLLCVGAAYPHKNIQELLYQKEFWENSYRLHIVSAKGDYRDFLLQEIYKLDLQDKVTIEGYVSKERLRYLYRNCTALVYPSMAEGFGIPPLEALSYGCPVIVSDISVFHEILSDAAIFVRLGNRESWQLAFQKLRQSEREKIRFKAAELIERYSFNNMRNVLRQALLDVQPTLSGSLISVE